MGKIALGILGVWVVLMFLPAPSAKGAEGTVHEIITL